MKSKIAGVFLLAVIGLHGEFAIAQSIVRSCDTDVQGPDNLSKAIDRGGLIQFACRPNAVIKVTKSYRPTRDLVFQGPIVLDGGDRRTTFLWATGKRVAFRKVTLRNFQRHSCEHSALCPRFSITNAARLELDHAEVANNETPFKVGEATVTETTFLANRGTALWADHLNLDRSRLQNNARGVLFHSGRIVRTAFNDNTYGGIALRYPTGNTEIRLSQFRGTKVAAAISISQRAGREGAQTVRVRSNEFTGNMAGAIEIFDSIPAAPTQQVANALRRFPFANFEFRYNRFRSNVASVGPVTGSARSFGGAIKAEMDASQSVMIDASTFLDNDAPGGAGGAVYIRGGHALVLRSIFLRNSGMYGAAIVTGGESATLANSVIAESERGAAVVLYRPASLINMTIASNRAAGLSFSVGQGGRPQIANSILSSNGTNCSGLAAGDFKSASVQYGDQSCPGVPVVDPALDSLYVPQVGSPVLSFGDVGVCAGEPIRGVDVLFQDRMRRAHCALGAYERPPIEMAKRRRFESRRMSVQGTIPPELEGLSAQQSADAIRSPADGTVAVALLKAVAAAERAAPGSSSALTISRAGTIESYVLERAGTDRFHMLARLPSGGYEFVRSGEAGYLRLQGQAWSKVLARPFVPDSAALVDGLIGDATQSARIVGSRHGPQGEVRFLVADFRARNGVEEISGRLQLAFLATGSLPIEMLFSGMCGGKPCAFHQRTRYLVPAIVLPIGEQLSQVLE